VTILRAWKRLSLGAFAALVLLVLCALASATPGHRASRQREAGTAGHLAQLTTARPGHAGRGDDEQGDDEDGDGDGGGSGAGDGGGQGGGQGGGSGAGQGGGTGQPPGGTTPGGTTALGGTTLVGGTTSGGGTVVGGGGVITGGGTTAPDTTTVKVPTSITLKQLLSKNGISIQLSCGSDCTTKGALTMSWKDLRSLTAASRSFTVGRGSLKLKAGHKGTLHIRATAKAKKRLRKLARSASIAAHRKIVLHLTLHTTYKSGKKKTIRRKIILKA
jgi:hypothetical protein